MVVVIAKHIPPAVRGRMKLWFVEPRANVFVSGIKNSVAQKVVDYLFEHCPASSGLTVFTKSNLSPGYSIRTLGETGKRLKYISGLPLIEEKLIENE